MAGCQGDDAPVLRKLDPAGLRLVGTWIGLPLSSRQTAERDEASGKPQRRIIGGEPEFTFQFDGDGTLTIQDPLFGESTGGTWRVERSQGNRLTLVAVMPQNRMRMTSQPGTDSAAFRSENRTEQFTVEFQSDVRLVLRVPELGEPLVLVHQTGDLADP